MGYSVTMPSLSPDLRWISFTAARPGKGSQTYVAPVRAAAASEEREWTAITEGRGPNLRSRRSPDGSRLYFYSSRHGSDCIWMRQLDPATKKPVGEMQAAYHLHNPRFMSIPAPGFGFSLARDKAVFPLREVTGNIWMAKLERQ